MKYGTASVLSSVLVTFSAFSQGTPSESTVTRVGLFKNGIACVERSVDLPADGTYFLAPGPEPLHGTVWIVSDADVSIRRTTRTLTLPRAEALDPLYAPLVGRRIGIRLRPRPDSLIVGILQEIMPTRVVRPADPYARPPAFVATPFSPHPGSYNNRMLVIDTDTGIIYVNPTDVLSLQEYDVAPDADYTVKEDVPALEFDARNVPEDGGAVTLLYLTKGVTWAPSYRLQLAESKRFALEQDALIVNELEDFTDVATELITGYPAITYANTTSPLAPRTSLEQFFRQVAAEAERRMDDRSNAAAITNQAVFFGGGAGGMGGGGFEAARRAGGGAVTVPPSLMAGDADLHYLPIGDRSLKKGDVLSANLGDEDGVYRNVLLWTESSQRENRNRYGNRPRSDDDPRLQYPGLWDAVVLENPFDRPLTTGPCYMELDGRFLAQTVLYWTAAGDEATLPLTKALGVPATVREEQLRVFTEQTDSGFGLNLQEIQVTMTIDNPRPEPQEVWVQYRFQARRVTLPDAFDARARVISPIGRNDAYLVEATMTVPAESTEEFQFRYEHHE